MNSLFPIEVTTEQYHAIGFIMFIACFFITSHIKFVDSLKDKDKNDDDTF